MNLELVAHVLRTGKVLAPDRFPAIPADRESARLVFDAWIKSLSTVSLPAAVWP